jgi:hypothetical protein
MCSYRIFLVDSSLSFFKPVWIDIRRYSVIRESVKDGRESAKGGNPPVL